MTDFKNKSRVDFQKHLEFLLVSKAKFTISCQKKTSQFLTRSLMLSLLL